MEPRVPELIASYDRVAEEYTRRVAGELAHKPFDRELLDRFAERARALGGQVSEVGCGPGHVTAYLHERGVDACGVDISPGMIERARALHPGIAFRVGDLRHLPDTDGTWTGVAALYSLIHLSRDEVAGALRELHRVLRPGGLLLIAFHVGSGTRHLDALFDLPVDLDLVFFGSDEMAGYLQQAGFVVEQRQERDPYPEVEAQTRRGYVIAVSRSGALLQ